MSALEASNVNGETARKQSDHRAGDEYAIIESFREADVFTIFRSLEEKEKIHIIEEILADPDEAAQKKGLSSKSLSLLLNPNIRGFQ